jgi:hypothetical protein
LKIIFISTKDQAEIILLPFVFKASHRLKTAKRPQPPGTNYLTFSAPGFCRKKAARNRAAFLVV